MKASLQNLIVSHAGTFCRFYKNEREKFNRIYEKIIEDLESPQKRDSIEPDFLIGMEFSSEKKLHFDRAVRARLSGNDVETALVGQHFYVNENHGARAVVGVPLQRTEKCSRCGQHDSVKYSALYYSPPASGREGKIIFGIPPKLNDIQKLPKGHISYPFDIDLIKIRKPYLRSIDADGEVRLTEKEKQLIDSGAFSEEEIIGALTYAAMLQHAYRSACRKEV